MKKIFRLLFFISCLPIGANAQGIESAKEYGSQLQLYAQTNKRLHRERVEKICDGIKKTRIADQIAFKLAQKNGQGGNQSYDLDSYLNWIDYMENSISIEFSEYKTEDRNKIEGSTAKETKYAREADKEYVSCHVKVKGSLPMDFYDLICMREGKITKISTFEKQGDRIKVDFSDLVSEHSIEVSYGYSSRFPMNIGISTNFSYFNIGVEYGMNFSDELLQSVNHTNYAHSTLERGKYWYLMATPGVYLRYASIDCGLGSVFAKYNYNYESVYTSTSNVEKKNYFIMKPKLTVHIPIPWGVSPRDEMLYISPHVGYQYVPKCSALNCWEIGIGVRFRFETY